MQRVYYHQNIFYKGKSYRFDNSFNKLSIPTTRNFILGVDQSTSAVGIAILEEKEPNNYLALCDLINNTVDKAEFMNITIKMLKGLTQGNNVPLIIMEDIYKYNQKLFDLRTLLRRNFKEAKFVKPSIWRKGFLDDENTTAKREKIKQIVVDKVIRENPELKTYYRHIGKDFDSLEAYGIAKGYLARQGIINVTMPKYKGNIDLKVLTIDEFKSTSNMVEFNYNREMSLEDNARRAIESIDKDEIAVALITRDSKYIIYGWDKGLPITPESQYIMYARTK